MSRFVDRRHNHRHKSAVNRERFMTRFRDKIKQAVADAIVQRSINDMDQGESIHLPTKAIVEPLFQHGEGGQKTMVLPGNVDFVPGDKIPRPPSSGGKGKDSQASNSGTGLDEFSFHISKEEFLDIFLGDLELPNLVKKQITKIPTYQYMRAGFTTSGIAANINVLRSLKSAMGRKIALKGPHKKRLNLLEVKLNQTTDPETVAQLKQEIELVKRKIKNIPFLDPIDIRYRHRMKKIQPSTQAVMFCLMDVSGSMDDAKKDIAKRFFILLYLFLHRTYARIDIVFIRHHTLAKEVNEQEFFYSRETGGTVVSSALELMADIIQNRYPGSDWNLYGAQASDGDNWNNDSPRCKAILESRILPLIQYFAYVEIMPRHHQSLWEVYRQLQEAYPEFAMQSITKASDIYPVFRQLFQKEGLETQSDLKTFVESKNE